LLSYAESSTDNSAAGCSYSEGGNKGLRLPTRDSDRPGHCLSLLLAPPGQHPRDSGKGIRLPVRIWRVP